jgi:hypothetical protein
MLDGKHGILFPSVEGGDWEKKPLSQNLGGVVIWDKYIYPYLPYRADRSPSADYHQLISRLFLFKICVQICRPQIRLALFNINRCLYKHCCIKLNKA